MDEIKELNALVSLMDEPNEDMFNQIRNKVISFGKQALPALEEAWVNTLEDDDSERIESIIDEIRQEELVQDFNNWKGESGSNIIKGLMILTKYFQPEFDEYQYGGRFEKLFRETWLEMNDSLTALEKIKVLNHVFYSVYQFNGHLDSIMKTDTYYLNKVFDYRKGNAISLGVLYIAVAQKLKIPVFGVNLPGHFILVYMDDMHDMQLPNEYSETDVLFYINAVNNGAIFTRKEVDHFISQTNIDSKPEFFLPCSNLIVIKRMINELNILFEKENNHTKTAALNKLLSGL
ncbi:MAG: hypothetical protein H8E34_11955 [Bacteroidetes bacterium]|nr:hypothetical protein [Bacteroidota bacterium]